MATVFACLLCSSCRHDRVTDRPSFVESVQSGSHVSSGGASDAQALFESKLLLNPRHASGLRNLIQVTGRIYSGGEPNGQAAFQELVQLGVRTIVSVDGAQPDLDRARQHGLRYVHIPIGYDGVEGHAALSIVRVMRETTGKVYVHCHHGRHRGPVAAAIACMADGHLGSEAGLAILQAAGTGRDYAGLWRDVRAFRPPGDEVVLPDLVEIAPVEDLAAAMAKMDRIFDRLTLLQTHQWTAPGSHDDLDAKQEALMLRELLHESGRLARNQMTEDLRKQFNQAETEVILLQDALSESNSLQATERYQQIKSSCAACHEQYRNHL